MDNNKSSDILIQPIHVAQIMGKLSAGGVEAVVFNYYREIDKTKVQFDFYYDSDSTVAPPQDIIDMGAEFYEIPPYQNLPNYIKTLRKKFREKKYTIVHSHINTLSVFPLYVAWREKIPVRIAHNHSVPGGDEFIRNFIKNILKPFSRVFATDYFACSEKAGRWLFGNKNYDNNKVVIINNAIDFDKFRKKRDEINKKRQELCLDGKFVVGHIGRFTYAKNHKKLIDVFEEICNEKENARLLLVGDGELHNQIVEIIKNKSLDDKVIFVGIVCDPEKYYQLSDVIVLPSLFEGLSLTCIESQIAGVPLVISEAIPDEAIISNGVMRCELKDDCKKWVESIDKICKKKLLLNEKANDYDIHIKASFLEKWYMSHEYLCSEKK